MDISIHGRNIKITSSIQSYVERKVERLDRYMPNVRELRVDLARENSSTSPDVLIAQLTLQHERGTILRAEERTEDLFASVDQVVDKMYRQIEKFKGRRRRRGDNSIPFDQYETAIDLPDEEFDTGKITRRKRFEILPMNEIEAVEQMEMLGHDFFIYLDGETGQLSVLYRRSDDNYGVIVPQYL